MSRKMNTDKGLMDADNGIFKFAFIGALLFVAAFSYTIANLPDIVMFELTSIIIASALVISSISMLYKAIKKDKGRLSRV
jgi:hypothetical protein